MNAFQMIYKRKERKLTGSMTYDGDLDGAMEWCRRWIDEFDWCMLFDSSTGALIFFSEELGEYLIRPQDREEVAIN